MFRRDLRPDSWLFSFLVSITGLIFFSRVFQIILMFFCTLQHILSTRSVCPGVSLPLQPLPRTRLLKVSVSISTLCVFYKQYPVQRNKRCLVVQTKVEKLFLLPCFVPKMLFAKLVFAQLLLCAPLQLQTKQIILGLQIASASSEAGRSWEVGIKQEKLFVHNSFEQAFLRAIPRHGRARFSSVLSSAWFVSHGSVPSASPGPEQSHRHPSAQLQQSLGCPVPLCPLTQGLHRT